jgi:thymidylate kinase
MLIVFSGTDGSGKSTQINLLIDAFPKDSCIVLWGRGGYTPIFMYLKKLIRFLLRNKIPSSGESKKRDIAINNMLVYRLWMVIACTDLFLYYGVYVRFMLLQGKNVICDRYIEDTQVDFNRNFSEHFRGGGSFWRLLKWSLPVPDQSFLLHVPTNVSLVRSKMKGEPFPDTPETLEFRLKAYFDESIFPSDKYHKIDCQKPIESINSEIIEKFKELS